MLTFFDRKRKNIWKGSGWQSNKSVRRGKVVAVISLMRVQSYSANDVRYECALIIKYKLNRYIKWQQSWLGRISLIMYVPYSQTYYLTLYLSNAMHVCHLKRLDWTKLIICLQPMLTVWSSRVRFPFNGNICSQRSYYTIFPSPAASFLLIAVLYPITAEKKVWK